MYEQMRTDFLVRLTGMEEITVDSVLNALDHVASKYDIQKKETDLVIYTGGLPELVKVYLVCKKMAGLSEATLGGYKTILTVFFREINKSPQLVTANDIRLFLYRYQEDKKVSMRTIDKYREYVVRFFAWAHTEGYLQTNPASNITAIKYEEKPREALSQVELEYIRMACVTDRERAIVEFLYSTGARVSELTKLKRNDIDWYEKSVHLFGKGKKHRTSFLNAKAEVALKRYLDSREDDCDSLFVTERKPYRGIQKDGIERIIRMISERVEAQVGKHVTPHVFRHTTATSALQSGMAIADISKLLGHESIDTTMIYTHSSVQDVQAAHKKHIV